MSRPSLSLLALLALCSAPSLAYAQDVAPEPLPELTPQPEPDNVEKARTHFQKGVDYYTEGDLTAAMAEFRRAYELEPSYRLLYNLAQVSYEQRDYAQSERYFRDYLLQGGDAIEPIRREDVEAELERLKGRVADVQLRTDRPNAQLSIDGHPVGESPLAEPLRVSAGRRTVRAELPGFAPIQRVIDVVGGEAMSVDLDFGAPIDTSYASGSASSGGPSPALWTGIATGVLALGAAGMAVWTASDDASYQDALEGETSRGELDDLADSTERKAVITDVLLGATIVGAAVTVYLLVTDGPDERPDSAGLRVGPDGSLHGTF
jgi:tetratricopeptide (TPR) repeat protein